MDENSKKEKEKSGVLGVPFRHNFQRRVNACPFAMAINYISPFSPII